MVGVFKKLPHWAKRLKTKVWAAPANLKRFIRGRFKSLQDRNNWLWYGWPLLVSVLGFSLAWRFRDQLESQNSDVSAILANLALVIGAVIAIPLGIWRTRVAGLQAETAEAGRLDERFLRGAEMLSSELPSVRAGGIFVLQKLAVERPELFHVQVLDLLCAFVRNPKDSQQEQNVMSTNPDPPHFPQGTVREDVQLALDAIGRKIGRRLDLEEAEGFHFDFRGADLRRARLVGMDFSRVERTKFQFKNFASFTASNSADFSGAQLCSTNLLLADFRGANLENACLCSVIPPREIRDANLAGANLHGLYWPEIDISGVRFSAFGKRAKGVRQEDIERCFASPDNPPRLEGVVDHLTGSPIKWGEGRSVEATNTDLGRSE